MSFPYLQRAAVAREKQAALHAAFAEVRDRRDHKAPANQRWDQSIRELGAALAAAYPPDFDDALEDLKRGHLGRIELLIEFLEADPKFFRSGYMKTEVLRAMKRAPLTARQVSRLQAVILAVVTTRWSREFADYARLALKLDDASFRTRLGKLLSKHGGETRLRAKRILATLPNNLGGPPRDWRRQGR